MNRTLYLFIAAALALIAPTAVQAGKATPLDGKSFVGQLGEKGMEADTPDELIFSAGQFRSTDCDQYGFGTAAYTVQMQGDKVLFAAATASPEYGTIKWQGSIEGDYLDATFTWHKERWYWFDTEKEYWFKGKLKE